MMVEVPFAYEVDVIPKTATDKEGDTIAGQTEAGRLDHADLGVRCSGIILGGDGRKVELAVPTKGVFLPARQ